VVTGADAVVFVRLWLRC